MSNTSLSAETWLGAPTPPRNKAVSPIDHRIPPTPSARHPTFRCGVARSPLGEAHSEVQPVDAIGEIGSLGRWRVDLPRIARTGSRTLGPALREQRVVQREVGGLTGKGILRIVDRQPEPVKPDEPSNDDGKPTTDTVVENGTLKLESPSQETQTAATSARTRNPNSSQK